MKTCATERLGIALPIFAIQYAFCRPRTPHKANTADSLNTLATRKREQVLQGKNAGTGGKVPDAAPPFPHTDKHLLCGTCRPKPHGHGRTASLTQALRALAKHPPAHPTRIALVWQPPIRLRRLSSLDTAANNSVLSLGSKNLPAIVITQAGLGLSH